MKAILIFLVISLFVGAAIFCTTDDQQIRLFAFAVALLAMGLLFPAAWEALPSSSVDLIYYSAAICGVLLYFFSRELEQQIIALSSELAGYELQEEASKHAHTELAEKIKQISSSRASTRAKIPEIESLLNLPEYVTLRRDESKIATAIIDGTQLNLFADYLRRRQGDCKGLMPILQQINAHLFAELHPLRLNSADGSNPSMSLRQSSRQAEFDQNTERMIQCMNIEASASAVGRLEPSFEKIQLLQRYRADPQLSEQFAGQESRNETVLVDGTEQELSPLLEKITKLVENRSALSALKRHAGDIDTTIGDLGRKKENLEEELKELKGKVDGAKSDIGRKKDETIRGWSLTASGWLVFRWPYLLISFLALKLARKNYLVG